MFKKNILKLSVCFTFLFIMLFTLKATNAYAADTKDVTVSVHQSINAPDTALPSILQSISTSTYNYDDGSYEGTLHYSDISNMTQTFYASYPGVTIYTFSFDIIYTGTVTQKVITTKEVTVTRHYDVTAPDSAIANVLQSISTSTYSYDDGSFKGTLNYSGMSSITQTFYASYPNVTLYTYSFDVYYTGTVTSY